MTTAFISPIIESMKDYPFERLRNLLSDITPMSTNFNHGEPIDVSIGEPRHPSPEIINTTIQKASHLWGKYPPVEGTDEFRQTIKNYLDSQFGLDEDTVSLNGMILPMTGTREGLFLIAQLANKIKDVSANKKYALMPNPFYTVYEGAAQFAGLKPHYLPTTLQTNFLTDLDAISPEILEQTAVFYMCSPSNPQGKAADLDYLKKLIKLARDYRFILVSDECYNELYTEAPVASALQAAEFLSTDKGEEVVDLSNLIVFHSLSKRSNAAGLRSGFACGDPNLIAAFSKLRRYSHAGMPLPLMKAACALWEDEEHVAENRAKYQKKFEMAEEILSQKIEFIKPDAGFFLWLEVNDAEEMARKLWAQHKIRVLPGNYITRPNRDGDNIGDHYIRIALVHDLNITEYVCEKLADLL